jgi:hydrogenase maturation protein HypF
MNDPAGAAAMRLRVRGVVQGVGFRPFVFRLAREHGLRGWVLNGGDGVVIHVEGASPAIHAFAGDLRVRAPSAARVLEIAVEPDRVEGVPGFDIRESLASGPPTAHISADLPVCDDCLRELRAGPARRRGYPYINCTACGPRYSILLGLPYDRPQTTMAGWPMCVDCAREYEEPGNRRFHAQPTACWHCGPTYRLELSPYRCLTPVPLSGTRIGTGTAAIARVAELLQAGAIVGVKGIGGYHLACDAANAAAVLDLRTRKFRREKPFAVMVRDVGLARQLADLPANAEALLTSPARPIVLARARRVLDGVAPDTDEIGLMLPYAPLHVLLFEAGAPGVLVMTSGNRSSEPIACDDDDARERLEGIADALLVGERAIARRVEDSVVRCRRSGPIVLRRSRGCAPSAVTRLPSERPLLAAGADLKNSLTLVVDGEAFVSQHIGDLDDHGSVRAFEQTAADLLSMYRVRPDELVVACDAHPQYVSTRRARAWPAADVVEVQHHRAHVASVLAERGAFDARVVGVAFDGTGYGDDGAIWGGELFAGSLRGGFQRAAHLREAPLVGGDAAARDPVVAAAGLLAGLPDLPNLMAPPFDLPERYGRASRLLAHGLRTFRTTSAGRLFDCAAALLGFTRRVSFEGQAAMWLEHLASRARHTAPMRMPVASGELDFRPVLASLVAGRLRGDDPAALARGFHDALADGVSDAAAQLAGGHGADAIVLSGGVFQNARLLDGVTARLEAAGLTVWTNREVPPNDGGISLGQAAIAACAHARPPE